MNNINLHTLSGCVWHIMCVHVYVSMCIYFHMCVWVMLHIFWSGEFKGHLASNTGSGIIYTRAHVYVIDLRRYCLLSKYVVLVLWTFSTASSFSFISEQFPQKKILGEILNLFSRHRKIDLSVHDMFFWCCILVSMATDHLFFYYDILIASKEDDVVVLHQPIQYN